MIQIDKNYRIEKDYSSWNLIFEQKGKINPKTNEPTKTRRMWYCANLEHALTVYADEVLKPCETVAEILREIKATKEVLKTIK